ncbi:beta-L-arabinofuranosidase domain-containing protein [Dactylosporangium sucinum]|uniref:Non-reducing end beta-L-arabinofuranosidase-like GH127 middle domain-containing protein n=1 Tax=Dactylosporangium sucinum TaxID=1424081 RepID=A0A917TF63_9ACTN|nr:beta-L-arabinofuranosidase domain-containing protein [Dactylosporangium sucinum]GGM21376.1 hypothetical protein GCM10007977_023080 [Dactylosporangium sucinum]
MIVATVTINGTTQTATPGTYASITRAWASGDTVTVKLPMRVVMRAANDNPNISAVTYGPVVLSGNYGDAALTAPPQLTVASISRTSTTALRFSATANGAAVELGPFYDAHGHNYAVYWTAPGEGAVLSTPTFRLVNQASASLLTGRRPGRPCPAGSGRRERRRGRTGPR